MHGICMESTICLTKKLEITLGEMLILKYNG
jgi:hypothetical protein